MAGVGFIENRLSSGGPFFNAPDASERVQTSFEVESGGTPQIKHETGLIARTTTRTLSS